MSWFAELLQRDGSVLTRVQISPPREGGAAVLTIGRALDNDLVLEDVHCAPHHARLTVDESGAAVLVDLNTVNGIYRGPRERARQFRVQNGDVFRLGQSQIRIRALAASMAPEQPLNARPVWPWALLGVAAVLGHGAWDIWLGNVTHVTPSYLNQLSGHALALCAWSGAYALLGRVITGKERFFTHVLIASCGYLAGVLLLELLSLVAFATSWLLPMQITEIVVVIVAAITVRFHLRMADPRHWPTLRYAVGFVAIMAIVIPHAQKWISQGRLTEVQTLNMVMHPSLRIAKPVTVESFSDTANELRERTEALRKKDAPEGGESEGYTSYDPDG
jgi:pSer/pThr/pTyr-binding forkhead associated (FHA) protein